VPGIPPSIALDHLLIDAKTNIPSSNFHPTTQGMAVFRIVANAGGTLSRWEFIGGPKELQSDAEKYVSQLRFNPLQLKDQTEPSPWWSFAGVCYEINWPSAILCEPPSLKPEEFKLNTVPTRLILTSSLGVSSSYSVKIGPFKRIKGEQFERPRLARLARIQGAIVIQFLIEPTGVVADIRVISGHPMLVQDAANKLQRWKFTPATINGEPMPASVTMTVFYAGTD
jgi:TonB family protein